MPELPEVQTVASELQQRLAGRTVEGAEVLWPRTVGHPSPEEFLAEIAGARVESVGRRAKYIVVFLAGGARLLIHLRMTGRITIEPAATPRDPYTRLVLRLDGGDELRFADTRKFGRFYLVAAGEEPPQRSFATLGPEPLEDDFTPDLFAARVNAARQRQGCPARPTPGSGTGQYLRRRGVVPRGPAPTAHAGVAVTRRGGGSARGHHLYTTARHRERRHLVQRLPHHVGPPGRLPGRTERLPQDGCPVPTLRHADRARCRGGAGHALLPTVPTMKMTRLRLLIL